MRQKIFFCSLFLLLEFFSFSQPGAKVDSFLRQAQLAKDDTLRANYLRLAGIEYVVSNPDSGLALMRRALALSEKSDWQQGIAACCLNMGHFFIAKGENDSVIIYSNKAIATAAQYGDKYRMVLGHIHRGEAYTNLLKYSEAMNDFQEAMWLSEHAMQSESRENFQFLIAECGRHIGNIYYQQGDYIAALAYFKKSLEQFKKDKVSYIIGLDEGMIGACYQRMKNYREAEVHFKRAIQIEEDQQDYNHLPDNYYALGALYLEEGKLNEAIDMMSKAVKSAEVYQVPVTIAKAYAHLGEAYYQAKDYALSIDAHQKGLQVSTGKDDMLVADQLNYLGLAHAYSAGGDYKNAYENFEKAYNINDMIAEQRQQKELLQLQTKFETTKKDRENVQLTLENEKKSNLLIFVLVGGSAFVSLLSLMFYQFYRRRQTKYKLETNQLKNKVLRTQLNPHFIFNALNSIRMYIQQHPEVADSYLSKFSVLMRQVLENSEEEKISLEEEIAMLENYMQLEAIRLTNGFDYEISLDKSIDTANTMVPPLILQPTIENAIWHGLKPLNQRGKIKLHFTEKNGLLEATIEDNGAGLSSGIVSMAGAGKKRSMGFQITRERIELLNRKAKSKGWLAQQLFEQGSNVKIAIPVS